MTSPPADATAAYELRVQGHLDQYWSAWFDGFTLTHQDDGTTTLRGVVRDQAELHGLLAKVRDTGTPLISVTPLRVTGSDETGSDDTGSDDTPALIPSNSNIPRSAAQAPRT